LGRAAAWGRAAAVGWPGVAPRVLVSGQHSVHWGDNGLLVCVRVRNMNRMKEIGFEFRGRGKTGIKIWLEQK